MKLKFFSVINAVTLLAASILTFAVPMSVVASGQTNWQGNGWPNPSCRDNPQTALWIFTGKGTDADPITEVTFHWDTGQSAPMTQMGGGGSRHVTVGFFDPTTNGQIYVTYDGTLDGNATLTLSGCNEGTPSETSTIVTTVHLGAEDDPDLGPVTVDSANPASLGSTVHDSAWLTFTGGISLPQGSNVVFYFFENNDCSGDPANTSTPVDVSGLTSPVGIDPYLPETPSAAGDYAYLAYFFSGDTSIVANDSGDCEPFTVEEQQTQTATISTTIHMGANDNGGTTAAGSTVDLGSTVHDSANLEFTGGGTLPANSTVTFNFWVGADCPEGVTPDDTTGPIDVAGASSPVSGLDPQLAEGPLAAGTYSYQAVFTSGDTSLVTSQTSDCELLTVNTANSSPSTGVIREDTNAAVADHGTLPLGTSVHDTATIDGQADGVPATGTVVYHFFRNTTSDPNCDPDKEVLTGGWSDEVSVDSNGDVPDSQTTGALSAGYYSFDAVYSGDNNYVGNTSPCEPFQITKADSSPSTSVIRDDTSATVPDHATLPLGKSVHDTATIGGQVSGFPATGTVKYHFFFNATADPNCYASKEVSSLNLKTWPQTVTVDASGLVPDSQSTGALGAGYYSFDAEYSGDGNYKGNTSACEPFQILQGTLTIRTDIHNAAHQIVTSVLPGTVAHDTATLGGAVSGFNPDMTQVSFTWFTNGTCYGTGSGVPNAGTESTYVAKSGPKTTGIGNYSFSASFAGDSNYKPAGPAACEPLASFNAALTPGYWKNHLADSGKNHTWSDTLCSSTTVKNDGGSCSSQGPWAKQYLNQLLGTYSVNTIVVAANVFAVMNCSSTKDQDAIGCLAGHLLAAKFNVANGANTCIATAIANADSFLSGGTVNGVTGINYTGPTGKYTLTSAQRALAISLKNAFDKYNNGGGC